MIHVKFLTQSGVETTEKLTQTLFTSDRVFGKKAPTKTDSTQSDENTHTHQPEMELVGRLSIVLNQVMEEVVLRYPYKAKKNREHSQNQQGAVHR